VTRDAEVRKVWDEFWAPIVMRGDQLDIEQVMRELYDYHVVLDNVPLVYDHVTGGHLSKPNTAARHVIEYADEHYASLHETEFE
jgi:hypothetical protein